MRIEMNAALCVFLGMGLGSLPVPSIAGEGSASASESALSRLPMAEVEKLANGLEVHWYVSDRLPLVDLALLIKSGYKDDPIGKSGTAELTAATLDRGAAGKSWKEIASKVERLGASRYASAGDDTFSVGMHGLAPDAPTLLTVLSWIATRPDFPAAEVSREHDRILDRWSRLGDYSDTLAGLVMDRLLTRGTIYGRGNFSSSKEFRSVGRDDVLRFHRQHFTPKNSVLLVVGNVDREEFGKKIREALGGWQGEAPERLSRTFSDPRVSARAGDIVLVDRPGLNQAQVRLGMVAPDLRSPQHFPLHVANALLGEYFYSRLNAMIRDKLGLSYGIQSSFNYQHHLARFGISSATRNESVGPLIDKTLQIVDGLGSDLPDGEITQAKDYLVGSFPLGVTTLEAVASRRLNDQLMGLSVDYLDRLVPRVQAVTSDEVRKAAREFFDASKLVIVVAGDSAQILKSLTPRQRTKVRRVSAKDLR